MSIGVRGGEEAAPLKDKVSNLLDGFLLDFVASKKGSISGEHGIGQQRSFDLHLTKSPAMIGVMR